AAGTCPGPTRRPGAARSRPRARRVHGRTARPGSLPARYPRGKAIRAPPRPAVGARASPPPAGCRPGTATAWASILGRGRLPSDGAPAHTPGGVMSKDPADGYALVVVANRLAVDAVDDADHGSGISTDAEGRRWRRSPGGLVTALAPIMRPA